MEVSNKEKFKSMSNKEKREYIWDYYKLHIIGSIIIILILSHFIYTVVTKVDTYCTITYYSTFTDENALKKLNDNLNNALLPNNKKEAIKLDFIFSDASTGIPANQELSAKIAAREVDLAIVSSDFFNMQASQDMFLDLESLKGFDNLNIPEEALVRSKDSSGKEVVLGINVDKLAVFNDAHFTSSNNILTVILNSKRTEQALNVIKELTK